MTPTQAGFYICLLIAGPLFGVWGGAIVHGTRIRWWLGFGATVVGAWIGWGTAAVVAGALHPSYPRVGPSEEMAILYLMPGFMTGVLTIGQLRRYVGWSSGARSGGAHGTPPAPSSWRPGCAVFVVGVPLALFAAWYIILHDAPEPARRALPSDARQVHEWWWPERPAGLMVDETCYRLKARISAAEFEEYMRVMKFIPVKPAADTTRWLTWAHDEKTPWFDPSPDSSRTFTSAGSHEESYAKAKYEDGWVYLEDFWLRIPRSRQ